MLLLFLILSSIVLGFYLRLLFEPSPEAPSRELTNQLSQVQNQNLRYLHEIRMLNKKYRRARLLNRKFQKERDVLKNHIGVDTAMSLIKDLYPEGNLSHLQD